MSDFQTLDYQVFEMFDKQWALATAGTREHYNACTIGWGSLGTIWAMSIVTIYVHPSRYTCEFLKNYDTFTVSFFPDNFRKALAYIGTHSGRDGDKIPASGLRPAAMGESMTFEEANLVFYCHKLCQRQFAREDLAKSVQEFYADHPRSFPPDARGQWEAHWMFIGEILEVRDRR